MSSSRATIIYALAEPSTGSIRYVGKTCVGLTKRVAQHLSDSRRSSAPVCRWAAKLSRGGQKPTASILEEVPAGGDWQSRERHWISEMSARGFSLLNVAPGGAGSPADRKDSEETIRRKREAQARVRADPAFHERVSAGLKRRWSDPAARAAQSKKLRAAYADPATRAKCAMPVGSKLPPEWAAAISAGKRAAGYSPSEETRRKISASLKSRGDPWAKARAAKRSRSLSNE